MQLTEAWTTKWWTTNIVWGETYFYLLSKTHSEPSLTTRWNSYETNLLSTFEGLLDSEALSDVTLFCEGQ